MIHDFKLPAGGFMCGFPQTLGERLQCAWFFLRYPGRVGIVYAPKNYDELKNESLKAHRHMDLATRNLKRAKAVLDKCEVRKESAE